MNFQWNILLLGVVFLLASVRASSLPGVPSSFTSEERLTSAISASVADEISQEMVKYLKTGVESARLQQLGAELRTSHSKKDIFTEPLVDLSAADQFFTCTICRATVNVFVRTLTGPDGELTGPNRDQNAKKTMLTFCDYFNIQTQEVCSGLFDLNWPIFDYIFNETIAESKSVCGMLPIKICQADQSEYIVNLEIVGDMPTESKSGTPDRSDKDFNVLHLTDIHYDPEYKSGGLADCDEGMCCRDPLPTNAESDGAGYWSDYRNCDTPRYLIVNAFEHISKTHKLDWIYHTGDVPPHNVWSTTRKGNMDMLTEIDALLTEHFPSIPVYPCLGNHEPHPANVFGNENIPDNLRVDWLYGHVWSLWSKWLPKEAETTIRRGGYYTLSPREGHRIIALNSMDCYLFNWWLLYDGSIVLEQLQWFHDTLLAAEKSGEHVHILTHIPSGDSDCWTEWSREYNRIVARFSKVITGIFNGHTHKDEMNVHYTETNLAAAVSWNGGSLTSYSYKNPNYRVYELHPETLQVLEHQTWTFNLTEANLNSNVSPNWYKEYEFRQEFTTDTSPDGIDKLLEKMAKEPNILRKFWRYKFTSADPKLDVGCSDSCLSTTICRLATSNYQDKQRCRELQAILKLSLENENKDDGAATLMPYSVTTLMGLLCLLRFWL
ncbi:sphingomyelin phosphodiesterase 1 [Drosophila grimshawi]|uniref:Sphingomyelin phosphodiesterase n=1 Tax=Drosophila grimshawi TaxID=7222 RepID=B4JVA7_DROGR|nr:sphingomyelin phosphodiesterase 1 [Drosophila grimshawi]EDV91427.1 GH14065 [Drosophila grimshawi]